MIEMSVEVLFGLCFIAPLCYIGFGYMLRDYESWCTDERDY